MAMARAALSDEEWQAAYELGRRDPIDQTLVEIHAADVSLSTTQST
jgi:hypothetical protein